MGRSIEVHVDPPKCRMQIVMHVAASIIEANWNSDRLLGYTSTVQRKSRSEECKKICYVHWCFCLWCSYCSLVWPWHRTAAAVMAAVADAEVVEVVAEL